MSIINPVISSAISRVISGIFEINPIAQAVTKVLIRLENPTANAFYSLSTAWVANGDFRVGLNVLTTAFDQQGIGGPVDKYLRLLVNTNGFAFFLVGDGSDWVVLLTGTTFIRDGVLHTLRGEKIGNTYTLYVDGTAEATINNSQTVTPSFTFVGKNHTNVFFNGFLSNLEATDLTTPANSLAFGLDNLTSNTESNNGVTLTYNNIAPDVRDTYTLSSDDTQLVSTSRTIDIAAQA
jgi:hypothetical protein